MPKILILLGSVRPARLADRVAIAVKNIVSDEGMEPEILDPAELPLEVVRVPLHFMKEPEKAPEWMHETNAKIKSADGFIIVSPEYNCSLPPALTSMLDHFPPGSFRHRPCGIITYSPGSYGGTRLEIVVRPFISELGMVSTPFTVAIPSVHENIQENGKCTSERIANNIAKVVKEVGWYADALKKYKESVPPPAR